MAHSNTAMRTDDYEEHFKRKHADGFAEEYEVQMGNIKDYDTYYESIIKQLCRLNNVNNF